MPRTHIPAVQRCLQLLGSSKEQDSPSPSQKASVGNKPELLSAQGLESFPHHTLGLSPTWSKGGSHRRSGF